MSGLTWSLYKRAELWRAAYGTSAAERRKELFVKSREFLDNIRHCGALPVVLLQLKDTSELIVKIMILDFYLVVI